MPLTRREVLNRSLRLLGRVLSFAGVGMVLWSLRDLDRASAGAGLPGWGMVVAVGAVGYLAGSLWLAGCWTYWFPARAARGNRRVLMGLYSASQVGKYLPGNVFHFLGRQSCGTWPGFSQRMAVRATLLETGLLLLAAGTLALGTGVWEPPCAGVPVWVWPIGATAALTAVWCCWRRAHQWNPAAIVRAWAPRLFAGWIAYLLYFLLIGGVFTVLGNVVLGDAFREIPLASRMWMYPVAWIAGFITPGAPGGLGVRESLLILALEPMVDAGAAAGFVVAFRLATVLGDLGLWGIGRGLGTTPAEP